MTEKNVSHTLSISSTSLRQLAIANVISNITIPLSSLSNVSFLGHLESTYHLSGVALVLTLFDSLFYGCSFLRANSTALSAQALGRGEDMDRNQELYAILIRNSLLALMLGGIVLALKLPLEYWGLSFLKTIPEIETISRVYLEIRIWAVPATLLNFVFIGWLLGQGKSNQVLGIVTIVNSLKVGLDYMLIIYWNLASRGAGWSVVISQYWMLLITLIVIFFSLSSQNHSAQNHANQKTNIFEMGELQKLLKLNGNIFIRSLIKIAVMLGFAKVGTVLGPQVFTENALLLEVIVLTMFLIEGIGYAVETLAGLSEGGQALEEFHPKFRLALIVSFLISFSIGFTLCIGPQHFFGLLTDHQELLHDIGHYSPWLAIVLCSSAVASIQESYFLGRAKGDVVRNVSLWSAICGFLPVAIAALMMKNTYLLWLAMIISPLIQIILFTTAFSTEFSKKSA